MGVFLAHPLLTALLLGRVSREAHALSQQAPTHRKLGFVAGAGMVLLLLGGLLFNLSPAERRHSAADYVPPCDLYGRHRRHWHERSALPLACERAGTSEGRFSF